MLNNSFSHQIIFNKKIIIFLKKIFTKKYIISNIVFRNPVPNYFKKIHIKKICYSQEYFACISKILKKKFPNIYFIILFQFHWNYATHAKKIIIINNKKKTIPLEIVAVLPNSSSCSPLPLFWSTNMVISQNPNVEIGRGWRRIPFSERAFLTLWLACFLFTHHIHPSTCHFFLSLEFAPCANQNKVQLE